MTRVLIWSGPNIGAAKESPNNPSNPDALFGTPISAQQKRKVAGYARVSTDHDDQFTSYEAQIDYYTNYIKGRDDWEFVSVYTDEGITGTSTKRREGFKRMIADALDGKIEISLPKWIQSHKSETTLKPLEIRHFMAFATSSEALGEGRFSVLCG